MLFRIGTLSYDGRLIGTRARTKTCEIGDFLSPTKFAICACGEALRRKVALNGVPGRVSTCVRIGWVQCESHFLRRVGTWPALYRAWESAGNFACGFTTFGVSP